MLVLALSLLLLANGPAHAEVRGVAVSNLVNLYELPNNPENQMPIADQSKLSTCWAYVASHLTEYVSRQAGHAISIPPLWTAIIAKKDHVIHWTPKSVNYNYMPWALHDLAKYGVCDADTFKSRLALLKAGSPLTDDELFLYLAHLRNGASPADLNATRFFKGRITPEMAPAIHDLIESRQAMTEYLFGVTLKGCPISPVKVPKLKNVVVPLSKNTTLNRDVHQSLAASQPRPVGIGYFDEVWKHPTGTRLLPSRNPKDWLFHYSVIVGEGQIGGRLHFLVRNSRGPHYAFGNRVQYVQLLSGPQAGARLNATLDQLQGLKYNVLGSWIEADDLWSNAFEIHLIRSGN